MKRKVHPTTKDRPPKRRKTKGDYNVGRIHPRQPGAELKAFDLTVTAAPFAAAGTFRQVNVMVVGNDYFNRVGRKVYMHSLQIRGTIENLATTAVSQTARIIVYYDSQPNGAAPVIGDILLDANAGVATNPESALNLNNRERFKILRDKQFNLPPCTNTAGVLTNLVYPDTSGSHVVKIFIKLKGLETIYNATNGGTIADINSGALGYVMVGSDSNWGFKNQCRLRFYD